MNDGNASYMTAQQEIMQLKKELSYKDELLKSKDDIIALLKNTKID